MSGRRLTSCVVRLVVGAGGPERRVRVPGVPARREAVPGRRLGVQEPQQVDQVGGGTQHRAAVLALAEVERPEQLLHRRVVLHQLLPDRRRRLLGARRVAGDDAQRRRVEHARARHQGMRDAADLLGPAVDQRRVVAERRLVALHERLAVDVGHGLRGVEALGQQQLHRLVARRDLEDPRDPARGFQQAVGVGAEVRVDRRAAELEAVGRRLAQQRADLRAALERQVAGLEHVSDDVGREREPHLARQVGRVRLEPVLRLVAGVRRGDQAVEVAVAAGERADAGLPRVGPVQPLVDEVGQLLLAGHAVLQRGGEPRVVERQQRQLALRLQPLDALRRHALPACGLPQLGASGAGEVDVLPGRALVRGELGGVHELAEAGRRPGRLGRGERGARVRLEGLAGLGDLVVAAIHYPGRDRLAPRRLDELRRDPEQPLRLGGQARPQERVQRLRRHLGLGRQLRGARRQREQPRIPARRLGRHAEVLTAVVFARAAEVDVRTDRPLEVGGQPVVLRRQRLHPRGRHEVERLVDTRAEQRLGQRDLLLGGIDRADLDVHRLGAALVSERVCAVGAAGSLHEQRVAATEAAVVHEHRDLGGRQPMLEHDPATDPPGVTGRADRVPHRRRHVLGQVALDRGAAGRQVPHRGLGAGTEPPRPQLRSGQRVAEPLEALLDELDVWTRHAAPPQGSGPFTM